MDIHNSIMDINNYNVLVPTSLTTTAVRCLSVPGIHGDRISTPDVELWRRDVDSVRSWYLCMDIHNSESCISMNPESWISIIRNCGYP